MTACAYGKSGEKVCIDFGSVGPSAFDDAGINVSSVCIYISTIDYLSTVPDYSVIGLWTSPPMFVVHLCGAHSIDDESFGLCIELS